MISNAKGEPYKDLIEFMKANSLSLKGIENFSEACVVYGTWSTASTCCSGLRTAPYACAHYTWTQVADTSLPGQPLVFISDSFSDLTVPSHQGAPDPYRMHSSPAAILSGLQPGRGAWDQLQVFAG